MKKLLIPIILLLAMGGCAARTVFYRDNTTQAQYEADARICEYEAMKYAGGFDNSYRTAIGSVLDLAWRQRELAIKCMEAKGYRTGR